MRASLLTMVFVSVAFTFLGLITIGSFETSDEHFWRDTRIPQYWDALASGDIARTAINDKPGVMLALISSPGLLLSNSDTSTVARNITLRVPLILFHGIVLLPLLWWLILKLFGSHVAQYAIVLIALNPVLIGISQILNPDALLWSTATIALLAFGVALTYYRASKSSIRYSILAGIFMGCALLSKYTANLLFLFYGTLIILSALTTIPRPSINHFMRSALRSIGIITTIAIALFALGLPAVFTDITILRDATLFSPPLAPIAPILALTLSIICIDTFFLRSFIVRRMHDATQRFPTIIAIALMPLLTLITSLYINAQLPSPFIPLENVKEVVDTAKGLSFVWFEGDPAPLYFLKEIAVQSLNLLFAIPTLTAIVLIATLTLFVSHTTWIRNTYAPYIILIATLPFLFFLGGLIADVFVTVRYSIILQPLLALLAAIGIVRIFRKQSRRWYNLTTITIVIILSLSAWHTLPYPFAYQNAFLPQRHLITDTWGYGSVEAATFLNGLPNAEQLTVWSDRKGVCYYFVGNCIMTRKIAPLEAPDYFVFTRRNVVAQRFFGWRMPEVMPYAPRQYYRDDIIAQPFWRHIIHNRPQNYTVIIKRTDAERIINNAHAL